MEASRIFICYRRSDSLMYARTLYGDLRKEFGDHDVFMDLPRKVLGKDFVERIEREIDASAVLLVVIGPDWLTAVDEDGKRRLDDVNDLVRIEIEAALARDAVTVIPLFVRGARAPRSDALPPSIARLSRLDGQALRDQDWEHDLDAVVLGIREVLRERRRRPAVKPVPPVVSRPDDPEAQVSAPREQKGPSRRQWLVYVLLGLALTTAIVAGAGDLRGGGASEPPKVRIGALYSLQGANEAAGRESLAGVRFARDYINGAGYPDLGLSMRPGAGLPSMHGAKLDLVDEDPGTDRCDTQRAFDRLVTDRHAVAVLGAYESTFTEQAIYAANRLKVPLVNGTATAAMLTEPDQRAKPPYNPCGSSREDPTPSDWFTRVGANDAQFADLFGRFIKHERRVGKHIDTVAVLYENNDIFGEGVLSVTANLAGELGIRLRKYPYNSQLSAGSRSGKSACAQRRLVQDMGRQVGRIADDPPDAVFAASYFPDAVVAVQTMSKIDYTPPALLAYGAGFAESDFIAAVKRGNAGCDLLPGDPRGIITRAAGGAQLMSGQSKLASKLFEEHYGIPMTDKAARAFTATMALAEAIDHAGSTQPQRVQDALRSLKVPAEQTILPGRGIDIDDHGQNVGARGVLLQILGNDRKIVFPTGRGTTPAVWPMKAARG